MTVLPYYKSPVLLDASGAEESPITQIDLVAVSFLGLSQKPHSQHAPEMSNHLLEATRLVDQWFPPVKSVMRREIVGNLGDALGLKRIFAMIYPQLRSDLSGIIQGQGDVPSLKQDFRVNLGDLKKQVEYIRDKLVGPQPGIFGFYTSVTKNVADLAHDMMLLETFANQDTEAMAALNELRPYWNYMSEMSGALLTLKSGFIFASNGAKSMITTMKEITVPDSLAEGFLDVIKSDYEDVVKLIENFYVDQ